MAITRFKLAPIIDAISEGATIVVPSLRIKDAILAGIHQSQLHTTYLTPAVVPVDVWIKDLWDMLGYAGINPFYKKEILSGAEEAFIWTGIIESSRQEIPLVNSAETALQVAQSYQNAQQWKIWQQIRSETSHYGANPDIALFVKWAEEFQTVCEARRSISLVDSIPFLIDSIISGSALFLPSKLVLSNFDTPPPLYRDLFNALASKTNTRSLATPTREGLFASKKFAFENRDEEIRSCADWASRISKQFPDDHIGIILPTSISDDNRIYREFNDRFNETWLTNFGRSEPLFNSSDSRALDGEAFIADALQFLSMHWQDSSSHEICQLLRSETILPNSQEMESRMQAELLMRRSFGPTCAQFELAQLLNNSKLPCYSPELGRALLNCRTLIRQAPKSATPSQAVELFKQLLQQVEWPGSRLSESQQKSAKAWDDCLRQFAGFGKGSTTFSYPTALAKLKQLLSTTSITSGFSAKRQLSLYTISEATGLAFDRVWLLGFDDQSWPPSASPSPFLPYRLQKQFKLPAASGKLQLEMAINSLETLKNSVSKELVISFFKSDGDQHFRASRLFDDIDLEEHVAIESWPLSQYSRSVMGQHFLEQRIDTSAPKLHESETIRGGQSVISNQSSCPFRAFARHRLNISPVEEFSQGLNSLARGIAVHIALENFYKNITSADELCSLPQEQMEVFISNSVETALEFLQRQYMRVMTPKFTALERTRISVLVSLFIDIDRSRVPFNILYQEKKYTWRYKELELTIKIDRIDQLQNGSLALIDYKTGKSAPKQKSWLEQRPEDMQLPFYFAVATANETAPVETLAIAHVNIEKLDYSALSANSHFIENLITVDRDDQIAMSWPELTALWQQRIDHFAEEFVNGVATVTPVNPKTSCRYCDIQPLCRIHEISQSTDALEEESEANFFFAEEDGR